MKEVGGIDFSNMSEDLRTTPRDAHPSRQNNSMQRLEGVELLRPRDLPRVTPEVLGIFRASQRFFLWALWYLGSDLAIGT